MSKTTELIEDINEEFKTIRNLSEDLGEHYRTLAALLVSAKTLVPEEKWDSWLHANCNVNPFTADVIIEGEFMKEPPVGISQESTNRQLEHGVNPSIKQKQMMVTNGKKRVGRRKS